MRRVVLAMTGFERLTDQEHAIIRMRFGLNEARRRHSLQETAKEMNVSFQRVQYVETRALAKLTRASLEGDEDATE